MAAPELETPTRPEPARAGRRLDVRGTVQGVGFRPFVYRLAIELGVDGWVRNAGGHVVIEATARPAALDAFARRLSADAPPLAQVEQVHASALADLAPHGSGFHIHLSSAATGANAAAPGIPPDVVTCEDCLRELFDPTDRRYRYPFVNCTNCGPRATIIDELPYDRSRTTMQAFPMCASCGAEYVDPLDRRFHAEPIACPTCGPRLRWRTASGASSGSGDAALAAAEATVADGGIVAVKGLGGYQLVCDATNADALTRLRARKVRPRKPFAVMVRDLAMARRLMLLTPAEEAMLSSAAGPIVLARIRDGAAGATALPAQLNPGLRRLGIFLPSTPLHHLLLADLGRPLVVTSGNRADEPMAIDADQAGRQLGDIADGFLDHDRAIQARYDDSVVEVVGDRRVTVRRARGFAPSAITLPVAAREPVLGVGAELKHTFTLAHGTRALLGPHTGDLENAEVSDAFRRTLEHLSRIENVRPRVVAHDLHPGYLSTQFAQSYDADTRIAVQHHHAHVASCAAEYGIDHRFIGVAYDGLGLGDDGTFWGGEILLADLTRYRRFARFSRAPLPGGAAAVRHPSRMALGYLFGAEGFDTEPGLAVDPASVSRLAEREITTVRRLVEHGLNSPLASSAGRLFDAVASLTGLCDDASYEGEAAAMLEAVAADDEQGELRWALRIVDGMLIYDARVTLADVVDKVARGTPVPAIAARFHRTLIAVTAALCMDARAASGIRTVCLSGGVFQNQRLAEGVLAELHRTGFAAYLGQQVPPNDGGVSVGQAAVAAARLRER